MDPCLYYSSQSYNTCKNFSISKIWTKICLNFSSRWMQNFTSRILHSVFRSGGDTSMFYQIFCRKFSCLPLTKPGHKYLHNCSYTDSLLLNTVAARSKAWTVSPARTLGSWFRKPLDAWMSVCVYSVFLLSCVQVAALRRADPPSKKS
jgi:hypothetical protein